VGCAQVDVSTQVLLTWFVGQSDSNVVLCHLHLRLAAVSPQPTQVAWKEASVGYNVCCVTTFCNGNTVVVVTAA
jgi:hypothetical protein